MRAIKTSTAQELYNLNFIYPMMGSSLSKDMRRTVSPEDDCLSLDIGRREINNNTTVAAQ